MRNKVFTFIVTCCLVACSNDTQNIEPTPLVVSARFDIPASPPKDIEKYFTNPLVKALKSAPHVSITHAIALKNGATVVVFFEDGIKFAEGEDIITSVLTSVKSPKKFNTVDFTELCGDDLSQSDLMHIAKAKGVKSESVFDNVITVSADIAKNILPSEEYNSMFANECDEPSTAPLYVLEN
ncbi:hypothetical protein [Candidatus Bodocaedibacter vickermanii]|uniref:Uncharacterized protein n=1 Tax=Candidatus Bodocaedibacter vickermanii TaxID=2741701 RepID=A0A7L9RTY7_9PROT|nr:hypothetical protein CPBP_00862 [Candidatus Paracaedibacteraceae bacterium 'Lake Konstanz']